MKKVLLVLMMTFSVSWMASAQVQFSFTSDSLSTPGGTVDIDVRISGFQEIVGMQLSFNWDADAFSFQEIVNVTDDLDEFSIGSIGTPENATAVQDGQLTMQWAGPLTEPRSLPDGTRLFTLRLLGSGPQCSATTLTISNTPRQIEIVDNDLSILSVTSEGGDIGIINATCPDNGGGGGGGNMEDGLAFSFDNVTGSQGSTICIPLRVNDFEDVFSFQSQFSWNPNVLRFTEIREAGLTSINLNDQMSDEGLINVVWIFDQASVTLPDGSALFELCFEVVGSAGQSSSLSLNNDPDFPIEISTGDGSVNDFSVIPLTFTVGNGGGGGNQNGVGLIAQDVATGDASSICVPITTRDFDAIGAFQAGITFDPSVLRFNSINQAGLTGVDVGDNDAATGMLRILWQADFSTPSVTLPDDTVLFELCFDVIGAEGTSSNIAFANFPPFNIEFSSEVGQSVDFFTQDGVVTVGSDDPPPPPTGDIEFMISNVSANRGQLVCVDVTTNNFTNIQGMGFAFAWDPSVMSFSDVRNITLPGLSTASFVEAGNNRLNLLWNPTSSQSVADGTVLFQLCFVTNDPCGAAEFSDVSFVQGNVPIEVIDASNNILDPDFTNGRVTIVNCNATADPFTATIAEIVQPRCFNSPEGVVRLQFSGAQGAVSCRWEDAATGNAITLACDLVGVVGGTYNFTGRDGAGREVTLSVTLNNPPAINIEGDVSGNGCDGTGQIALRVSGGTGGYTYDWTSGLPNSPTLTGLSPGTFRVTVRDENGCPAVRDFVVPGDDLGSFVNPLVTNNTNEASPNGSIDLRPTANNLTYSWSTGATTSAISGLPGGDYSVRVSNDAGCSNDFSFTVVDDIPDEAISGADLINNAISRFNGFGVTCTGESDGILDGTITGACDEGPVRVFINGTEVTLPAENLPAGMHTLRLEDACGDVFEEMFILEEPDPISLSALLTVVTCPSTGQNNGVVSFPLTGGTGIYTITPSIGQAAGDNTVSGVGFTPFNIVVQDENGCQVMFQDQEITDPPCDVDVGPEPPISDFCEGRAIISPNGDAVNDNFLIPCVAGGNNQPNSLAIYDRWGNLVMEADNYDNTWMGTNMDGEPLPEGGYMWVLRTETPGQRDLFRGTVSILR